MKSIAVSELRENLPSFLKEVEGGKTLVVTSRGREVARLVPPISTESELEKEIEEIKKNCKIGDVVSPLDAEWKALK